jgi:hypothetical protein
MLKQELPSGTDHLTLEIPGTRLIGQISQLQNHPVHVIECEALAGDLRASAEIQERLREKLFGSHLGSPVDHELERIEVRLGDRGDDGYGQAEGDCCLDAALGGAKRPSQIPETIMEFRAPVDADVDPDAQCAEPSRSVRSEQCPIGANRSLEASGSGCDLKHLVEAVIEQRLAAG